MAKIIDFFCRVLPSLNSALRAINRDDSKTTAATATTKSVVNICLGPHVSLPVEHTAAAKKSKEAHNGQTHLRFVF